MRSTMLLAENQTARGRQTSPRISALNLSIYKLSTVRICELGSLVPRDMKPSHGAVGSSAQ